jgi:hypothetical protein
MMEIRMPTTHRVVMSESTAKYEIWGSVSAAIKDAQLDGVIAALHNGVKDIGIVFAASDPNRRRLTATVLGVDNATAELMLKNAVNSTLIDAAAAERLRRLRARFAGRLQGRGSDQDLDTTIGILGLKKGEAALFLGIGGAPDEFPALLQRLDPGALLGTAWISLTKAGERYRGAIPISVDAGNVQAGLEYVQQFHKLTAETIAAVTAFGAEIAACTKTFRRIPRSPQKPYVPWNDGLY